MANLPSSAQYMNDLEVAQDKPVTEAVMSKIGSNINYLLDQDTANSSSIATLQAAYNQQETSFGPINDTLSGLNVNSDTVLTASYTVLRGRPVLISFTSGAAICAGGSNYGRVQILRNGSPITTLLSGSGLVQGTYSTEWGTQGNLLGNADIDETVVSTIGPVYAMHTGGSLSFFDNPGAGTHSYSLRIGTVGNTSVQVTSISGFIIEL